MRKTKEHATRQLWKPKALQEFFDILGNLLSFPDLEPGESPQVGDTVLLDGQFITGTYWLAEGDILIIEEGEIIDVVKAEEEVTAKLKRTIKNRRNINIKNKKS
nr:hypothetical protein [uncultured Allomuricauda sp.]